jgi:hypothetical protein
MENQDLKIVNSCCSTIQITFYLEAPVGQYSNLYLNAVHILNISWLIRHLLQLKTVVFQQRCLIYVLLKDFERFTSRSGSSFAIDYLGTIFLLAN